jgi:hypothetical protein
MLQEKILEIFQHAHTRATPRNPNNSGRCRKIKNHIEARRAAQKLYSTAENKPTQSWKKLNVARKFFQKFSTRAHQGNTPQPQQQRAMQKN